MTILAENRGKFEDEEILDNGVYKNGTHPLLIGWKNENWKRGVHFSPTMSFLLRKFWEPVKLLLEGIDNHAMKYFNNTILPENFSWDEAYMNQNEFKLEWNKMTIYNEKGEEILIIDLDKKWEANHLRKSIAYMVSESLSWPSKEYVIGTFYG